MDTTDYVTRNEAKARNFSQLIGFTVDHQPVIFENGGLFFGAKDV